MKVPSLAILSSLTTLALLLGACSSDTAQTHQVAPADEASVGSQPASASLPLLADDIRLNDPKPKLSAARSAAQHLGHTVDKHLSATQVGDKALPSGVTPADLRQQPAARPAAFPQYQLKQQTYLARLREIPSGLSAEETDARRAALKQSVLGE